MKRIDDKIFKKIILRAKNPVLVDFFTPTCQPCKLLAPLLDKLAAEMPDIAFVKLDASESDTVADEYDISAVPTLILFNKGIEISRREGLLSIKKLKSWLKKHL